MILRDSVTDSPFGYTLSVIGGKWKMAIMFALVENKVMRFSELLRYIPHITQKMLSAQLKELEADGIILRKEYQQIPPKVEYSLTKKGLSLMPVLNEMCKWGRKYRPQEESIKVCDCDKRRKNCPFH